MKLLRAVMKGEYYPVNFSKARFKSKIKDIESEAGRRDYDPSERFNKDDIYPKKEMREIINYLRRQDLNETFPFDITTDPEPKIPQDQIIQQDQKQSSNTNTTVRKHTNSCS